MKTLPPKKFFDGADDIYEFQEEPDLPAMTIRANRAYWEGWFRVHREIRESQERKARGASLG